MTDQLSAIQTKLSLGDLETLELMQAYAAIINELKKRQVLRTTNNPVADYTEWLVAQKLSLTLEGNSSSGFDAVDKNGSRIQIKSRRNNAQNKSVRLSSIRNLPQKPFDELIGVIYDEDFEIKYAARVPYSVVLAYSTYNKHTNSHIFHLRRSLFENPEVVDLTSQFIND
ncbi:MAG: hypothetical protein ACTSQ8_24145 [Candidatus Helarchaeota archaeon]